MSARFEDKPDSRPDAPVDLLARLAHTERLVGDARRHEPSAKPASKRWLLLAIAITASAGLASLATYGLLSSSSLKAAAGQGAASGSPTSAPTRPVGDTAASPGAALETSGYVVARNKASVSSDITGRVESIAVVVGQTVNKGEVIAKLDNREARLRLAAAQITLTQSQLAVENARVIMTHEREKLEQLKGLVEQKFVSEATYKQAVATLDSAAIQVKTAEANMADARNSLLAARIFVERHVIRAPFDGVVVAVSAGPGETVSPTSGGGNSFIRSGIVQLVDPISLYVVAEVPERQVQPIHVGQEVEIVGKSASRAAFAARVTWVAPVSNRQRGVVEVGIDLTDPTRRFIDGMEVDVRFFDSKAGSQKSNEEERLK